MKRVRALAALAGLLGLGSLAAGLADAWPEPVRAVVAVVVVLALPALLLARRFARGDAVRENNALRASLAFLSWLSILAVWTAVFTAAGASFRTYAVATVWALLLGYATAAIRAWRSSAAPRGAGLRAWGTVVVVAGCAVFAALNPPRMTVSEDSLDHVGYVRHVLTEDSLRPVGVLAPAADDARAVSDPRKGALHPVIAFTSWVGSTDPMATWHWLPVVLFPAAALALIGFNDAFVASARWRVLVAALVLVTFDGNPFRFAAAAPHGETIAATWGWVLAGVTVASRAALRPWHWLLLACGGVLVHLGVAWHGLVLIATIAALGRGWGMSVRERLVCGGWIGAGIALALVLRLPDLGGGTNVIHAHRQGVMLVSGNLFVASPMEILRQQGLVFLGGLVCIPLLALSRDRGARRIAVAAAVPFAVCFVPWIATWLHAHASYMVFRSLLQVPAFAAVAMTAQRLVAAVRARNARVLVPGLPAAALWLLVFARPVPGALARDLHARAAREPDAAAAAVRDLARVVAGLPAGSVILSDPATSYALSARTPQRFVTVFQQHGNPRDTHALERIRAVRDVLSPYVVPEAAPGACRPFAVDYVVMNGLPPAGARDLLEVWDAAMYRDAHARMRSMAPAFAFVDSTAHATVYRFEPDAGLGRGWSPRGQPVVTGAPPLLPCSVEAPGGAFRVTGIALDRERVLPGDRIRVTLGYYRDAPRPFALPSTIHLRFDHEEIGRGAAVPGEKQWRRMTERRQGAVARFRRDLQPGHAVLDPDLWPVGFDLCETFEVDVPASARAGMYTVELSIEPESAVPNFHVRDLLFDRDHYSGQACATLEVAQRVTGGGS